MICTTILIIIYFSIPNSSVPWWLIIPCIISDYTLYYRIRVIVDEEIDRRGPIKGPNEIEEFLGEDYKIEKRLMKMKEEENNKS